MYLKMENEKKIMIRYCTIKSGSSDNCSYIEFGGKTGIILDVGIDTALFNKKMRKHNINNKVEAVFVSHSHKDHSGYLSKYKRAFRGKQFITWETPEKSGMINNVSWKKFSVEHDVENYAYLFECNGERIFWATDFCAFLEDISEVLDKELDLLMIECNYDEDNPQFLQTYYESGNERHLSLQGLKSIIHRFNAKNIQLLHLSSRFITPERIVSVLDINKKGIKIQLQECKQENDEMTWINASFNDKVLFKLGDR